MPGYVHGHPDRPPPGATATRAERPRRGEQLELTVERLAHGGAGVARRDRYVVFVEGAFPGERVRAEVYAREARLRQRARRRDPRAAARTASRSAATTRAASAPARPWQPLRYERQVQYKHELVEDALTRIGGFEGFEMEPIVPAVNPWRYRNKMEYTYGPSAGKPADGFADGTA